MRLNIYRGMTWDDGKKKLVATLIYDVMRNIKHIIMTLKNDQEIHDQTDTLMQLLLSLLALSSLSIKYIHT